MCIGIPMQVCALDDHYALCEDGAQRHRVDIRLIARPRTGDWLLVFLGSAREILDAERAHAMRDAREALGRIMSGDPRIDHLFDDLIEREPEPPEHLRPLISKT